jgi:branched-chain amino acid transport system substrate-binding protein
LRFLALIAALSSASCSLALKFNECDNDDQCKARGDTLFCTPDHFCAQGPPLCAGGLYGAPPGGNTVMIAGLFRLSGASGDKDTEMAQAAQLAIEEISRTAPIGMVLCDTAGSFKQARSSLRKALFDYKIVGAVGPTTSGEVLGNKSIPGTEGAGAGDFATENNLVIVSPSATNPSITDLPDNGLIWRTAASDNFQAVKLAALIPPKTGGVDTKINIAYVDTPYGQGLKDAFIIELSGQMRPKVLATVPFMNGDDPHGLILTPLANSSPNYSMIVADEDAAAIANELYKSTLPGLMTTQFLFTDGAKGPSLIGMMPSMTVAARIRGTGPATPSGPVYEIFRLSYTTRFGSDPSGTSFVANAYDATYALALGVAGSLNNRPVTGTAVSTVMKRMSATAGTRVNVSPNDFIKGTSALSSGGSIDLIGTSGPLTWNNDTGDLSDAPLEVWGINFATKTFCTYDATLTMCQ